MAPKRDDVITRLTREMTEAVAADDLRRVAELNRRLEVALTARLKDEVEAAEEETVSPPDARMMAFFAPPARVPLSRRAPRPAGSARQAVIASLAEIGVLSRARLIGDYAQARFDERIDPRAFATLRRDERRAWGSTSPRPVYVVPALEGRFFQPVRAVLGLSDWTLEQRLVGPWSERHDHLAATAQLARQLAWLNERDPDVAKRLAPVVAGMARSIPGAVEGGEVDTARVREAAEKERVELAAKDKPWREVAADRARTKLNDVQQLWGIKVGAVSQGDG
jgi:hypothetical protein